MNGISPELKGWRPPYWKSGHDAVREVYDYCSTTQVFELGADVMLEKIAIELKKKDIDLFEVLNK